MLFNPQQFIDAPPIELPYQSPVGITVTEIGGKCKKCNENTQHLRGYIAEHKNCMEIRFAGVCKPCKLITSYHLRYYNNGRILSHGDNGWVEYVPCSLFKFLIEKIKTFLSKYFVI